MERKMRRKMRKMKMRKMKDEGKMMMRYYMILQILLRILPNTT